MPALTYYMQESFHADGAQQSATPNAGVTTTSAAGWVVAKVAAANYADFDALTERTSAAFSTTVRPTSGLITTAGAGNALKTNDTFTGSFDAGNWTFVFSVIATTASTQRGAMRFRVHRDSLLITPNSVVSGGTISGSDVRMTPLAANLGASQVDTTVVVSMPAVTFSAHPIAVTLAWEITQAGGSNGANVRFRQGSAGTRFTTANFTGSDVPLPNLVMAPRGSGGPFSYG